MLENLSLQLGRSMTYNLVISDRTEELIDNIVEYLVRKLKNEQAAVHFLDDLESIYARLEENPFQFHLSADKYLKAREYREAFLPAMAYKAVFRVEDHTVYIVGVFHDLENHTVKIPDN